MRSPRPIAAAFAALLCLAMPASAFAQTASKAPGPISEPTIEQQASNAEQLNTLFAELKRERNVAKANRLADRIWKTWLDSGSATVDLLMMSSQTAVGSRSFALAMDLLDQIILLQPDWAEGWNRRATLHFMMRENAKSISDIERTLALEPRHFGALVGLAGILRSQGDNERALEIYLRALDVYPMMRSAQDAVAQITEELASQKL